MEAPSENIVVRLAKQPPPGPLASDTFDYVREPLPALADGELLVQSIYAAVDAGSRASLDDRSRYVGKIRVGGRVFTSAVLGRVVDSRHPAFRVDDWVRLLVTVRQTYLKVDPKTTLLTKVEPADAPLQAHVGILGATGFTAWIGVFEVAQPRPGETFLVSAAAGAVGMAAGQFARTVGARVVGIASGPAKCRFVRDVLGFDECIDRTGGVAEALTAACPQGVDVYFENVGGDIQRHAFALLNEFGRVAMCGQVAQYSGAGEQDGPNLMQVVLRRLTLRGFLAGDYVDRIDDFQREVGHWLREGRVVHHATVTVGLYELHEAINAMMEGRNIGQQLHQMADDPSSPAGPTKGRPSDGRRVMTVGSDPVSGKPRKSAGRMSPANADSAARQTAD